MPRRNRSRRPQGRPIRTLTPSEHAALKVFAGEHLDEHAYMCLVAERTADGGLPVTGSECSKTGVRFLSIGPELDASAVQLAGVSSDPAGKLVR